MGNFDVIQSLISLRGLVAKVNNNCPRTFDHPLASATNECEVHLATDQSSSGLHSNLHGPELVYEECFSIAFAETAKSFDTELIVGVETPTFWEHPLAT
ncbi:hypothetical protein CDAR_519561 [Caerostris darwini]|uniref:Uncharacterized protein n=1 Tax=Caerostris darwini TaxID=1538125 RepID=A0AAV4TPM5_9ARAC|nr:hypothetical protein CDAR_519561 [Caerostris darwini]